MSGVTTEDLKKWKELSNAIMNSTGYAAGIRDTGIALLIIGAIGSIVSFFLKDSYSKKDKNNNNKDVK